MDDVNDDAKAGFRRIELLTGPERRRRWSAEEKARIVADTLEPDARVSEVARRWQVCPQQVFRLRSTIVAPTWRDHSEGSVAKIATGRGWPASAVVQAAIWNSPAMKAA